jgi:hypothetical protein
VNPATKTLSAPPPRDEPGSPPSGDPADFDAAEFNQAVASAEPPAEPIADPVVVAAPPKRKRSLYDRIEAYISVLSTKNNFWHRVCSLIWLPFAFRSGIKMKRLDAQTFTAVLPFRRFNRNWYNAMAGAALLGNAEIAGGTYVFGVCGGDYTVVCKHLQYRFLRPCFGPAIYKITPRENIEALVAAGGEFNITVDMDVVQQLPVPKRGNEPEGMDAGGAKGAVATAAATAGALLSGRDRRVGKVEVTFHVTPKVHHKDKAERRTSK